MPFVHVIYPNISSSAQRIGSSSPLRPSNPTFSQTHKLPPKLPHRPTSPIIHIPVMSGNKQAPPSKRLCVFSDGTWQNAESENPTNIYTLATAVNYKCDDGVPQMVYYDPGVGTGPSIIDRVIGGAFGEGIDLNIQQLYTFLALNYDDGDEIYLVGFSRGAYTVRSLAGMMNYAGLIYRDKLDMAFDAYELYRAGQGADSVDAVEFREKYSRRVPIKHMACFDTVGSLGIPMNVLPMLRPAFQRRYQFHDTMLSEQIEQAVHVLSIDEDRVSFTPTLMHNHTKRRNDQVTEVYFPGGHGGVGGGSDSEKGLSDNTLIYVSQELMKKSKLALRREVLPKKVSYKVDTRRERGLFSWLSWGALIRLFTGSSTRDIESSKRLHKSALIRYQNDALWRPQSLEKFKDELENFDLEKVLKGALQSSSK